jgi:transcriptional antiterminator NusG
MTEENKEVVEKKYTATSESHPDAKWFVVQTQSNTEKKAKSNLLEEIKLKNLEDRILEVFHPIIESVEMKAGQKRKVSTKPFSGYIFVFAIMDAEVCNIIKNTQRIIGFPSKTAARPLPLRMSTKEIQSVIDTVDKNKIEEKNKFSFIEGATVKVINSELAFYDMVGRIKTCNEYRGKAKIEISIFGRETEVEVPLDSIEVYKED